MVTFAEGSWADERPEMCRNKVITTLAGPAADGVLSGLSDPALWTTDWKHDTLQAINAAVKASGSQDLPVLEAYFDDCLLEATQIVSKSTVAITAVAKELLAHTGERISGESLTSIVRERTSDL